MYRIKKPHRENLEKLRHYLLSGALQAEFDMISFSEAPGKLYVTSCGSVGCALGHGPYAGVHKLRRETWFQYSNRCFGIMGLSKDFDWLFSEAWSRVDNTPQGCALRIDIYLDLNTYPTYWEEQMTGKIDLMYRQKLEKALNLN